MITVGHFIGIVTMVVTGMIGFIVSNIEGDTITRGMRIVDSIKASGIRALVRTVDFGTIGSIITNNSYVIFAA